MMPENTKPATLSAEALSGRTTAELETLYGAALGKLPSRAPIYLPTERVAMIDRVLGAEHVRQIYQQDLDATYRPRLRALRERYKGHRRCFLIGNGPSLNRTDLSVLKDEVTFAVNGFFLKARDLDWLPTFFLVEDHLVAEDRAHWINQLKGPIKLFPAYLGYAFPAAEDTIFYNHRPRKSYPHGFDFSLEADKITYTGCTVTFSMMQIAAWLGFQEIYLIGVDASYDIPPDAQEDKDYAVGVLDMKSDDPNHFDPDYFGKGFRWHDPQVGKMLEAYEEARRTLEGTSQRIYNATVGGQLEVFDRHSFASLFPQARSPEEVERDNAALRARKYPKLLLLDMTAMGNGTATGELKASLFEGWPADRLLQIARHGQDGLATVIPAEDGSYRSTPASEIACHAAVQAFAPDVVLYRPVPKVPWLHDFAMRTIAALERPLVTWLMDDWPTETEATDPAEWARLGPDLRRLLDSAALNLSICDRMSGAFGQRYGVSFRAFANGVNPVQWPALRQHEGRGLKIRYSGGLARNMTLDSVLRVAGVVERLARAGRAISLEISTQSWWLRDHGHHFTALRHVSLDTISRDAAGYRAWLAEADAVLIAYNFDDETRRYVRYSMANKMPECLASGAVVLCHGPRDLATVDYLQRSEAACVVDTPDAGALATAILALAEDPARRNLMARKARALAFERHNIVDLRESLRAAIAEVAGDRVPATSPAWAVRLAAEEPRLPTPISSTRLPAGAAGLDAQMEPLTGASAGGWTEAHRLLVDLSGRLLLDPASTLEELKANGTAKANLDTALRAVSPTDPVRLHFDRVMDHVRTARPGRPEDPKRRAG